MVSPWSPIGTKMLAMTLFMNMVNKVPSDSIVHCTENELLFSELNGLMETRTSKHFLKFEK